jgi:probable HAF family extracellular repeat protein
VIWDDRSVIPLFLPLGIAYDINNRGEVVGIAANGNVLWDHGTMIDLGEISPVAINDRGQIAGGIKTANAPETHAALWENGAIVDLGVLPGDSSSFAQAINNSGQIIGSSYLTKSGAPLRRRAFIWDKGTMLDLPGLDGQDADALAINDRGQVVGDSGLRPVMWENGVAIPLETLPAPLTFGRATAINNKGDIVGFLGSPACSCRLPVLWENGTPVALPMFPSLSSFPNDYQPTDINNSGTIIGYQQRFERVVWPLVWVRNGRSGN